MKKNWIKRGAPVVALFFLVAFGVMSCSTDPMSSPDNGSSTDVYQNTVNRPNEAQTMEEYEPTKITGHLRMDESGACWYLVIRPGEAYELMLERRLRAEENGRNASIEGCSPGHLQPRCSYWPIFKVEKLRFLD